MRPEIVYFIGLSLGQRQDYTGLAIIERHGEDRRGQPPTARYDVRYLKRYPLGTSYPAIVADVAEMLKPLADKRLTLIIDATGVGPPVVQMFEGGDWGCAIASVTITGGFEVKRDWSNTAVPKRDLVSSVQVLLQSGRLKIASELSEAATLVRELENFRAEINLAADDTYLAWREGTHDDLVLSVALAAWYAAHGVTHWSEYA